LYFACDCMKILSQLIASSSSSSSLQFLFRYRALLSAFGKVLNDKP
jgi:hypothetical protein